MNSLGIKDGVWSASIGTSCTHHHHVSILIDTYGDKELNKLGQNRDIKWTYSRIDEAELYLMWRDHYINNIVRVSVQRVQMYTVLYVIELC